MRSGGTKTPHGPRHQKKEARRPHRLENTTDTVQDLEFLFGIPHEVDLLQVGLRHGIWQRVRHEPNVSHRRRQCSIH